MDEYTTVFNIQTHTIFRVSEKTHTSRENWDLATSGWDDYEIENTYNSKKKNNTYNSN